MFKQHPAILAIGMALLLSAPGLVAQTGDDYLRQLDSEASDLNLDAETRGRKEGEGDMRSAVRLTEVPADDASELAPGLSREAFEASLKRNYMGSYTFFLRLSPERRDALYASYLKDPDPQRLRDRILKALKQQRGKP